MNSKCGRKDTFICLGDIVDVEYVRKIRAKYKILICGNHDRGASNYERKQYFCGYMKSSYTKEQALADMKALYPECRLTLNDGDTCWGVVADNMLFDEVYTGPLMIAENIILSHEPVDVPWAFNIHGHIHDSKHKNDKRHFNVCSDAIGYVPINMNQWMKSGAMAHVETIHRTTIDSATIRKAKRGGKKLGER